MNTIRDFESLPACLTVKELRMVLGISRPKAYELVNTKDFPAIRIGRVVRIPKAALEEWLKKQVQK